MANNVVMRQITVTDQWQPLSGTSVIGTFTVSSPPSNANSLRLRTASEPDQHVTWVPGEYHTFTRIDLASIQVMLAPGSTPAGDLITINGGSS